MLLASKLLPAQEDSAFVLVRSYDGDITDAAIDNLDNLYIITSTGQVRKYAANGDSLAVYNQVRHFGKPTAMDVSNPLKPLLFYRDFSTIVVLDRFLANRATLDLRKFGILQPGAIGLSYDNNIWVFDEWDQKLKKINEQGTVLTETADFRTLFDQSLRPQRIVSDNNLVYVADSLKGIYVFDLYGSFKRKLPLMHYGSFAVKEGIVFHVKGSAMLAYNTATFMDRKLPFPPSFAPYLHIVSTPGKLLSFTPQSLRVYTVRF